MKCRHESCHCETMQLQTAPEGFCSSYCTNPRQDSPEGHCVCGHPSCVRAGGDPKPSAPPS